MEHAKKMAIVPTEVLNALRADNSKPNNMTTSAKNIHALDKDMQWILKRTDLDEYEKATRYQQILQKYLTFHHQKQNPLAVKILTERSSKQVYDSEDDPTTVSTKDAGTVNDIVNSVPSNMRNKAKQLMHKLLMHKDVFSWNDRGELILNKSVIPHSNLNDLIIDVLRPHGSKFDPIGHEEFVQGFADINVPESLISNSKRRSMVRDFKQMGNAATSMHEYIEPKQFGKPSIPKKTRTGLRSQSAKTGAWVKF